MIAQKSWENWIVKHWLAIMLTGLLPVWWAAIWMLSISSTGESIVGAIVLMIPLGIISIVMNTATAIAIRDLIFLAIFGFVFGWLAQTLWNRNKWTRFFFVAFLTLNSCVFLGYTLMHLD